MNEVRGTRRRANGARTTTMRATTLATVNVAVRARGRAREDARGARTRARARISSKDPWWEKGGGENMIECDDTMAFLGVLNEHSDKLVVVDVYARWCGACRALYPKLCKIAAEYPDVVFVKVNFDANKDLCKSLGVKVLPYFKFYRGTEGCVAQFSASIAKIKILRAALNEHSAERCAVVEGARVEYDDVDDLRELEEMSEQERRDAEPSPVAS